MVATLLVQIWTKGMAQQLQQQWEQQEQQKKQERLQLGGLVSISTSVLEDSSDAKQAITSPATTSTARLGVSPSQNQSRTVVNISSQNNSNKEVLYS